MAKPNRSQFIEKLHDLLEHPYDPDNLHWVGDDAFSITVNDAAARRALSAKWEFRSLSSFIRQLSYYGFRRLSDRRRSGERKSSSGAYIVFAHPSGFFIRGDPSPLPGIVRKTRNRPSKRRASASSAVSNERSDESPPPPPVPQWAPPTEYHTQYADDRNSSLHPHGAAPTFHSSFGPLRTIGDQQAAVSAGSSVPPVGPGTNVTWRAYTTPTWSFTGTSGLSPQQPAGRRTSVSDFKISAPVSPRSANKTEVPSPRLRKAASSLSIQTVNNSFEYQPQQQQHEPPYSPTSLRQTPYPTPAFTTYPLPSGSAATVSGGGSLQYFGQRVPPPTQSSGNLGWSAAPRTVMGGTGDGYGQSR
ncbi:hypothetical protein BCR35DRAFT_303148 [Leucosporidium creatinivorum]|uniref:HSF-type DNA-binding domain-containing protein n=1 Tax=Leucosporidium creatinivorum TaxID=106004 RepID=A0A1Y2FMY9_9BASI|nr:hypothetical protein BCR35DRAFT_303148 [Leucosporidium creatinivorum]